jgi:hypothetical protein
MALKENGDLVKVSLILTTDQDRRMRQLHQARRTDVNRLSFADIGREVVEAGLAYILDARLSNSTASRDNESETAA